MAAKPTYEELEQRVKELEKKSLEQNSLERALRENEELLKETILIGFRLCLWHSF